MGFTKKIQNWITGHESSSSKRDGDGAKSDTPPGRDCLRPRSHSSLSWHRLSRSSSRSAFHHQLVAHGQLTTPNLSRESKYFDAQITPASLSQILVWYIYYDIVCVVEKGCKWYQQLPIDLMCSWIRLGYELEHGVPPTCIPALSKGLQKACDEMGVDADDVRRRLVRLSHRNGMLRSELALIRTQSPAGYAAVAKKLENDKQLTEALRPIRGTTFLTWRAEILDRIEAYMKIVVLPAMEPERNLLPKSTDVRELTTRDNIRTIFSKLGGSRPMHPPDPLYRQALHGAKCEDCIVPGHPRNSQSRPATPSNPIGDGVTATKAWPTEDGKELSSGRNRSPPHIDESSPLVRSIFAQMNALAEEVKKLQLDYRQNSIPFTNKTFGVNRRLPEVRPQTSMGFTSNTTAITPQDNPSRRFELQLRNLPGPLQIPEPRTKYLLPDSEQSLPIVSSTDTSHFQTQRSMCTVAPKHAIAGSSSSRHQAITTAQPSSPQTYHAQTVDPNAQLSAKTSSAKDSAFDSPSSSPNKVPRCIIESSMNSMTDRRSLSNHSQNSSLQRSDPDDGLHRSPEQNAGPCESRPRANTFISLGYDRASVRPNTLHRNRTIHHDPCPCPDHSLSQRTAAIINMENMSCRTFEVKGNDPFSQDSSSSQRSGILHQQPSLTLEPYGGFNPFEDIESEAAGEHKSLRKNIRDVAARFPPVDWSSTTFSSRPHSRAFSAQPPQSSPYNPEARNVALEQSAALHRSFSKGSEPSVYETPPCSPFTATFNEVSRGMPGAWRDGDEQCDVRMGTRSMLEFDDLTRSNDSLE